MSGLCVICNQKISSEEVIVYIGNCGKVFHYECASERYASLKTRGSKKEWTCDDCRPKQLTSATKNVGMEETPATKHDALVNIMSSFKTEICSELKEYRKQFDEFKLALEGIPVTTNEDAVSLATDVGAALGVVLRAEDVMAAHRVPTFRPRAAPPLVVQLRDRRMKETIVAAYKKKKELKASEMKGSENKVPTIILINKVPTTHSTLFIRPKKLLRGKKKLM
ncbi:hypothetical protein J6590_089424 [Homalodisca vitripennis]|nr:hypothetical protein J6590_089424 [Homalodisca vitripennis]